MVLAPEADNGERFEYPRPVSPAPRLPHSASRNGSRIHRDPTAPEGWLSGRKHWS